MQMGGQLSNVSRSVSLALCRLLAMLTHPNVGGANDVGGYSTCCFSRVASANFTDYGVSVGAFRVVVSVLKNFMSDHVDFGRQTRLRTRVAKAPHAV